MFWEFKQPKYYINLISFSRFHEQNPLVDAFKMFLVKIQLGTQISGHEIGTFVPIYGTSGHPTKIVIPRRGITFFALFYTIMPHYRATDTDILMQCVYLSFQGILLEKLTLKIWIGLILWLVELVRISFQGLDKLFVIRFGFEGLKGKPTAPRRFAS